LAALNHQKSETAMKRVIITSAVLPSSALAELKLWLGITTVQDDAPLTALLRSSIDICEGFTGIMPIAALCEEVLPAQSEWQALQAQPVQAITSVQGIPADGVRFTLPAADYAVDLDADGSGRVLVRNPGSAGRIAVRFTAGLAANWDALPDALRHGIMRLAAHQHRERETSGAGPLPPAAVAALWRPWRRMHLL
jgi:uncharacterized phiE125 gp8 family phage protein